MDIFCSFIVLFYAISLYFLCHSLSLWARHVVDCYSCHALFIAWPFVWLSFCVWLHYLPIFYIWFGGEQVSVGSDCVASWHVCLCAILLHGWTVLFLPLDICSPRCLVTFFCVLPVLVHDIWRLPPTLSLCASISKFSLPHCILTTAFPRWLNSPPFDCLHTFVEAPRAFSFLPFCVVLPSVLCHSSFSLHVCLLNLGGRVGGGVWNCSVAADPWHSLYVCFLLLFSVSCLPPFSAACFCTTFPSPTSLLLLLLLLLPCAVGCVFCLVALTSPYRVLACWLGILCICLYQPPSNFDCVCWWQPLCHSSLPVCGGEPPPISHHYSHAAFGMCIAWLRCLLSWLSSNIIITFLYCGQLRRCWRAFHYSYHSPFPFITTMCIWLLLWQHLMHSPVYSLLAAPLYCHCISEGHFQAFGLLALFWFCGVFGLPFSPSFCVLVLRVVHGTVVRCASQPPLCLLARRWLVHWLTTYMNLPAAGVVCSRHPRRLTFSFVRVLTTPTRSRDAAAQHYACCASVARSPAPTTLFLYVCLPHY